MEHIVTTAGGRIRGYERGGMVEYLGIPYAQPPVGELRFKRAVAKAPWEGIFDAKDYGAAPIQLNDGRVMGNEDCLTLNVQRPVEGDKLPVFVWIYGGGYNTGYSADEMYRGEAFVRDGVLLSPSITASTCWASMILPPTPGVRDLTPTAGCPIRSWP